MHSHARWVPERLLRQLGAFFMLLLLIGPLAPIHAATVAAQDRDAPPDLAAMVLTPWDLADAGLDNYGHGFSEMTYLDFFASGTASLRGLPEDEVRNVLENAGFLRAYSAYFYARPDDDGSSQAIISYVIAFEDEDGAADGWDFLEDESDRDDAEDIDGFDDVGDASEATLSSGENPDTGDPYTRLDVSAQTGAFHVGVTIDIQGDEAPDEELAAELMAYAIEQVETGRAADQPALSNMVARLTGEGIYGSYDTYVVRDGEAIWYYGETPDVADDKLDQAEEAGEIDEYQVWQGISLSETDPDANLLVFHTLARFEDDEAAKAWLLDRRQLIESDENSTEIEVGETDIGDGGFTHASLLPDGERRSAGITFQFGSLVAVVGMFGPIAPSEGAIDTLADAQLDCLDNEGCLEPIELSGDLADYVADAEDAVGDDSGEDGADAGASTENGVYISEQWGYTVVWDPDRWDIQETSFPDGILLVLDDDSNTLITISGEETSDTDPVSCVDETVDTMNSMTADDLTLTDDVAAPATADDASGAVYEAGEDILFYEECRVLVESEAVLTIGYRSDEKHWDEFLPDLEELLASIELATG